MSDLAESMQWPGMLTNVAGAWLLSSTHKRRRHLGFWVFLVSSACWLVWGIHVGSWAIVTLQVALTGLNIRGLLKTDPTRATASEAPS